MDVGATEKDLEAALAALAVSGNEQALTERNDAVDAAKVAVRALVISGAIGKLGLVPFVVNLSGHANPGHVPAAEWTNDALTITVFQPYVAK